MTNLLFIIFISLIMVLFFLILLLIYYLYQIARNEKVYNIRMKWLATNQIERHKKYSYDEMLDPNKSNWYGFKYPKDEHYK